MPVGGRTVNLGNVIFGLGVNPQGLQRATADLQAFSRATDRVARVGTTASLALANSMARMERQAASALQSVLNLDARIRRAGAPPQLLAANTREFQRLSAVLTSGTATQIEMGRAIDALKARLGNSSRALAAFTASAAGAAAGGGRFSSILRDL